MSLDRLALGLGGRVLARGRARAFERVSTDSRTLRRGDVFVALKGPRFDGARFYGQALRRGAAALAGPRLPRRAPAALIQVPGGLSALQRLAAAQRRMFNGPVIAVTGSNGKSSAKDCLLHLLGGPEKALATPGNFNNEVGLPLAILGARPGQRAAVLELGMNHAGELLRLARLCRPDIAVVLNVGDAHLGHFHSRAAIAAAKEELLRGMGAGGIAVLNSDDPLAGAMARRFRGRVLRFGTGPGADLRAEAVRDRGLRGLQGRLRWRGSAVRFRLRQGGRARLNQALASVAAGLAAGRDFRQLAGRLETWQPSLKGRQQLIRWKGHTILMDAYNASPQSMAAGLDFFAASAPAGRRLAVLGDMLELGRFAPRLHRDLGRRARRVGIRALAALGQFSPALAKAFGGGARAFARDEAGEAAAWLTRALRPGDWIFFKGSRGVAVERVFDELKECRR